MYTALDIICKRTSLPESEAEFYECMADERVRNYLGLPSTSDTSRYAFTIADIGVLLYQRDHVSQTMYESETFTEGSVSHTVKSMIGSSVYTTYDNAISEALRGLTANGESDRVIFL